MKWSPDNDDNDDNGDNDDNDYYHPPSFLSGRSLGTSTVYPLDLSRGGLGTIDRSIGLTVMIALGEWRTSAAMNLIVVVVLLLVSSSSSIS